jgi:hypothetical protein
MPNPNPVQEAVLDRWGITVLSEEDNDPERALQLFLSKLKEAVDRLSASAAPDR